MALVINGHRIRNWTTAKCKLIFILYFKWVYLTTDLSESYKYLLENEIDEIYCSITELSNSDMLKVIDFADNNLKILKFLPDNKDIYSKKLKYELYEYILLSYNNIFSLFEQASQILS